MKLEVKVNFDFGKLEREMPKIIHNYLNRAASNTGKGARENIDSGNLPPLKEITLKLRRMRGISGDKPLYATGEMYKSIKPVEGGLSLQDGATWHHMGLNRPKRFFIEELEADKKDNLNKFTKERQKALHLSTPIVLKT